MSRNDGLSREVTDEDALREVMHGLFGGDWK